MKFKNISPKKDEVKVSIDPANFKAIITKLVVAGLVIGFVGTQLYFFGSKLYRSKDAMLFAFDHPEVVVPVQEQYEAEYQALQDSFAKRQVPTLPAGEDSPKE